MASQMFNEGLARLLSNLDWTGSGVIKARLIATSPAKTVTSMTGLTAITNSTDQTLVQGNRTRTKDDTNNRIKLKYTTTLTWTAVNGGGTIQTLVIYVEDAAADASRVPLILIDPTDLATNGSDITYTPPSNAPDSGDTSVVAYVTN